MLLEKLNCFFVVREIMGIWRKWKACLKKAKKRNKKREKYNPLLFSVEYFWLGFWWMVGVILSVLIFQGILTQGIIIFYFSRIYCPEAIESIYNRRWVELKWRKTFSRFIPRFLFLLLLFSPLRVDNPFFLLVFHFAAVYILISHLKDKPRHAEES